MTIITDPAPIDPTFGEKCEFLHDFLVFLFDRRLLGSRLRFVVFVIKFNFPQPQD